MGRSVAAALMAAWTSWAAASIFRSRSNCKVTLQPPRVLTEVISETPAIWPRRRSSGVASEAATVAGSAPGSEAETITTGKSTRGTGATGMYWKATSPARNSPSASSEVPTGRRMKGAEMFMASPLPAGAVRRWPGLHSGLRRWPGASVWCGWRGGRGTGKSPGWCRA